MKIEALEARKTYRVLGVVEEKAELPTRCPFVKLDREATRQRISQHAQGAQFRLEALIDLVRKGFFPAGSKVLYAHLGGAPALNGYGYTFRNG